MQQIVKYENKCHEKDNTKKLHFNALSVTALNSKQLRKIPAASDVTGEIIPTLTQKFLNTQTNPRDGYSVQCIEIPIPENEKN